MKFAYPDWPTCKRSLLGGHGKARRTVTPKDWFQNYISVIWPTLTVACLVTWPLKGSESLLELTVLKYVRCVCPCGHAACLSRLNSSLFCRSEQGNH